MRYRILPILIIIFMLLNCGGGGSSKSTTDDLTDPTPGTETSDPDGTGTGTSVPDPVAVYDAGDYDTDIYLTFEWTNPEDVSDVKIQIATDRNFEDIVFGSAEGISIGNVESYDYTAEPSDGPDYYARVKIINSTGDESIFGESSDGIIIVGSLSGKVVDGLNITTAIDNANITLKRIYDESVVCPEFPDVLETNSDGNFNIENVPVGSSCYKIEVGKTGYYNTTINDITIDPGNNNIGQISLVEDLATTALISGKVVSANDASAIGNATVNFYDSYGNLADTQVSSPEEDENKGTFSSAVLDPGTYTIEIIKTAYVYYSADNIVVDGRDGDEDVGNQVICEELQENQIRVIVQWGASPKDLDLHCVGPTGYSVGPTPINNRFHIRWDNKTFDENTGLYSEDPDPTGAYSTISIVQDITELYGETGGYGPEAINLFNNGVGYAPGVYRFTVMNCTRQSENWYTSSPPIEMRVYNQYGLLKSIQIATGGESYLYWKAIEIEITDPNDAITEDNITVVNEFDTLHYNNKTRMDWQ